MASISPISGETRKVEKLTVIALNCPNCGAHLDATSDLDTLACTYCGSAIKVARCGDNVSLARIERIAAELALEQLKYEHEILIAAILSAEHDLQMTQKELQPVKTFDVSYPLTISGECKWSAKPRHELAALIKWTSIAIVIGMMFGFATFIVVSIFSWWRVLASRNKRISGIEESNSLITQTMEDIQSRLSSLRERAISVEKQVEGQRMIVESRV